MATLQYSVTLRNAQIDAISTVGAGTAKMEILTGAIPANCAAARTGTVLATLTLPATWISPGTGGTVVKVGTWEDTSADAAGTAGYFRLYKNDGTTVVMQGDITATAGGGAMTLDNIVFAAAQNFTVTGFTLVCGNA